MQIIASLLIGTSLALLAPTAQAVPYPLAVELKKAGYPQTPGEFWKMTTRGPVITRYGTTRFPKSWVRNPTAGELADLIPGFTGYLHFGEKGLEKTAFTLTRTATGATMDEAMAKLWLLTK